MRCPSERGAQTVLHLMKRQSGDGAFLKGTSTVARKQTSVSPITKSHFKTVTVAGLDSGSKAQVLTELLPPHCVVKPHSVMQVSAMLGVSKRSIMDV